MAQLVVGTLIVELDENGFLEDQSKWNEDVAKALAINETVEELTEEHWTMINYIRDYYEEYEVAPMIRRMVKVTGFDRAKICVLFPSDSGKCACKIAGLPKPKTCM